MTKKIKALLKLIAPGGAATPAPPIGSALGQHGLNIMDFCKQFNALTSSRKGESVPVVITVFQDKTFSFITKTTPTSNLIKKYSGVQKGSSNPKTTKVGELKMENLLEIAKIKLPDLNTDDIEEAKQIVAGTAKSMGISIV